MFEWWQQLMKGDQGANNAADPDDPELLLTEAQRQMREAHQRNRERAVQAITQKNNLLQMVDEYRRKIAQLQEKAAQAEATGRSIEAIKLRDEAMAVELSLRSVEESLRQAVETVEAVKVAMRHEEESVRRKTQETLHLKAQWRLIQAEQALAKSHRLAEQSTTDPEQFKIHLLEASDARDHLLGMVEETTRQIAELRVKAEIARKRGNDRLEREFLREMEQAEATLDRTQEALVRANAVIERLDSILRGEQVEWVYVDPAAEITSWAEEEQEKKNDQTVVASLALAAVLIVALLLLFLFLG